MDELNRRPVGTQVRFVRWALASACIVLAVAACGGGALSVTEYSERAESMALVMLDEFDVLEEQWASATTVEEGKAVLNRAVAVRTEFQNGLSELIPPETYADLHTDLGEHLGRILDAQEAWAARADTANSLDELRASPEAVAYWNLDAEMYPLCLELQARLDATAEREILAEVPWIPTEMKEVVAVVMGC
jgi:hypothetical protein